MATSLTVFVCSTFSDLSGERGAVLDAIRRLQLQHDSMEFFGARAEQPIETCLLEVRKSDVLVVIVGHRYGTIVPELGVSYSEAEYSEGYRLEKPCLVYIRDENVLILPRYMERDPQKLALLEKWKATLQERHTVAVFQDGSSLAVQVVADLSRTIQDLEEVAKTRAAARLQTSGDLLGEINGLVSDALQQGVAEASLLSAIRRSISSLVAVMTGRKPTIHLSHAFADVDIVTQVAEGLMAAGIQVRATSLPTKAPAPEIIVIERMEMELAEADFIGFFISPNFVQTGWTMQELQLVLHRRASGEGGAVVIPILLADADVPPLLRQFPWLDLRDGDIAKGIRRLVEVIHRWSDSRGKAR